MCPATCDPAIDSWVVIWWLRIARAPWAFGTTWPGIIRWFWLLHLDLHWNACWAIPEADVRINDVPRISLTEVGNDLSISEYRTLRIYRQHLHGLARHKRLSDGVYNYLSLDGEP
jgi:hypothetical protein